MVGTGAVTIPWAFSNSGMILGFCNDIIILANYIYSFKHYCVPCLLLYVLPYYQNCWQRHRLYRDPAEVVRAQGLGGWHGNHHRIAHDPHNPILPAARAEPLPHNNGNSRCEQTDLDRRGF